jgi:hypothetical protein
VSDTMAATASDAASGANRRWDGRSLRLWHRLFSAGMGDVAQFRGWDRLITWKQHATHRDRWHAVKRLLKLPARAAREALGDVQRFGREVTEQSGVPQWQQLLQLWWLRVRHGLDLQAYLDYRLYRPERWVQASEFLAEAEWFRVMRFIMAAHGPNSDARMLGDKLRFDAWCREHGFPSVATLVEIEEGRVTHSSVAPDSLPARDLFSKPADSTGGHSTCRWLYDGAGAYVGADGRARRPAELIEELAAMSRALPARYGKHTRRELSRRILLQSHLHNHASLSELTTGALSTVRLATYRFPQGEAQLLFAAYKLPVGRAPADNFHYGGIVAHVDLATGRLGPAIYRRGKLIFNIDRHPDTGAPIEGHQLPFWQDTLQLALRAHNTLRGVASVGWDIALCEEGPVFVEGNTASNPDIAQAPSGVPLGTTPFVRCMNAHLEARFGL